MIQDDPDWILEVRRWLHLRKKLAERAPQKPKRKPKQPQGDSNG